MIEWVTAHWSEVFMSLLTAGLLAFCRWVFKEMKGYKEFLNKKDSEKIEATITEKLQPIEGKIQALTNEIKAFTNSEEQKIEAINDGYRFRIISLCSTYLERGYMTQPEYRSLTELFKVYTLLGGNGQAHEIYEKTCKLKIKSPENN